MKNPWKGAPGEAPPADAQNGVEPAQDQENVPPADGPAMESTIKSRGAKKVGKWSIDQLRQTDGIIPLQYGTNKFASQKLMTGFGTPRNTTTKIKAECLAELPEEIARASDGELRLQSGTNRFASQKGMTGMGTPRDVVREAIVGLPADLEPLPEEKLLACEGIVRLQSGTNKYASQKGMTGIGTNRRETTKMLDSKHPEYSHETSIDQSEVPLQSGTNKFDSQKGMTGFGTNRREITKMKDSKHPEFQVDHPDQETIPLQSGTNKFASQAGMTGFGQPRWECLNPLISHQSRESHGQVRYQMGSNLYASQQGMTGFGTPRDVKKTAEAEGYDIPLEEQLKSETIIRSQAGWNRGDSQKGMTGFGAPRDVKGKHLKRLWELEYPEEAEAQNLL